MEKYLFNIENLRCSYEKPYIEGASRVVLEIRRLQIDRGKKVFIVGESGIGKSTILETLGMMNNTIVPDSSTCFLFQEADGRQIDLCALWHKSDGALSRFRLHNYSFIFQSTNLMRNFTAFENVAYTRMLQGYSQEECFDRTRQVLDDLGLERINEQRMTQELSGGQQQRLAFARAILPDFTVLFGDEPTGNLDSENAERVMCIIRDKLNSQQDASAVIVSHDMHLATNFADIIIKIRKGVRPKHHNDNEDVIFGIIDETSVFHPNESRTEWGNGRDLFSKAVFEDFLCKK
jgi:ABC-type lipoprotein export system ATPase subunit